MKFVIVLLSSLFIGLSWACADPKVFCPSQPMSSLELLSSDLKKHTQSEMINDFCSEENRSSVSSAKIRYHSVYDETIPVTKPQAFWFFTIEMKSKNGQNMEFLFHPKDSKNNQLGDLTVSPTQEGTHSKKVRAIYKKSSKNIYSPPDYQQELPAQKLCQIMQDLIKDEGNLKGERDVSQSLPSIKHGKMKTEFHPAQLKANYFIDGVPLYIDLTKDSGAQELANKLGFTSQESDPLKKEIAARKHLWQIYKNAVLSDSTSYEKLNSNSLSLLRQHAMSDFGFNFIKKVFHSKSKPTGLIKAMDNGWLNKNGSLTDDGSFDYTDRFLIQKSKRTMANRLRITMKEPFYKKFYHGKKDFFSLSILHHEFGHTNLGISMEKDVYATMNEEIHIMDHFETPVRLQYGYQPRYKFRNPRIRKTACSKKFGCQENIASVCTDPSHQHASLSP